MCEYTPLLPEATYLLIRRHRRINETLDLILKRAIFFPFVQSALSVAIYQFLNEFMAFDAQDLCQA